MSGPVNYLTPKKSLSQIARERAEAAEQQNIDVYEAIAGLYEEIADLTERVEQLEGGNN